MEWNSGSFSDESRFCLVKHNGRARVRGDIVHFSIKRHVQRTVSDMIWGAIANGSRLRLVFIRDSLTAQRYFHEMLQLRRTCHFGHFESFLHKASTVASSISTLFPNRTYIGYSEKNVAKFTAPPQTLELRHITYIKVAYLSYNETLRVRISITFNLSVDLQIVEQYPKLQYF